MLAVKASSKDDYARYVNPKLAEFLKLLRIDKSYHKGEGTYLYYHNKLGEEIGVIDCLGSYGANLLGHNPQSLKQVALDALAANSPVFTQMSIREDAAKCAAWLYREAKAEVGEGYLCNFTNSGAEAVELALKHTILRHNMKWSAFDKQFEKSVTNIQASLEKGVVKVAGGKHTQDLGTFKEYVAGMRLQNQKIRTANQPMLLSAENAYHGKTSGALSLTWNPHYRHPFFGDTTESNFFPLEIEKLQAQIEGSGYCLELPSLNFKNELVAKQIPFNRIAAVILEPIQGEGGIRMLPAGFLEATSRVCTNFKIPLIIDEIQTGCYRTGALLASAASGVQADYYLLGKALGGGMSKVAAVLIREHVHIPEFGLLHSSTYAEDSISSRIAREALIQSKKLGASILRKGSSLLQGLQKLQKQFPAIIKEVRGQGLMIGLEFRSFDESDSYCFQLLSRSGYLHYVYVGYLLNQWNVRLAAPISAKHTLRIQPPASIAANEIKRLLQSLEALCRVLQYEDAYKLIEFLLPANDQGLREAPADFRLGNLPRAPKAKGVPQIGFVTHFINRTTIWAADPSLRILNEDCLEYILDRVLPISVPIVTGSALIKSKTGESVHATLLGLCVTSKMCKNALVNRAQQAYLDLCNHAVDDLIKDGANIIGLGQYSSIIMNNARDVTHADISVTTGNSFTVYLGIQAILKSLSDKGIQPADVEVGVIGAAGNIASSYAHYFSRLSPKIKLLGSNNRLGYEKAKRTARDIYSQSIQHLIKKDLKAENTFESILLGSETLSGKKDKKKLAKDKNLYDRLATDLKEELPIKVVEHLDDLYSCQVIIVATNASEPFLEPHHFQPNTIICDISVPLGCSEALIHNDKGIEVLLGGIAQLPHGETIPTKGFPLDKGLVFGCLGETLLLGLEQLHESFSFGNISVEQIDRIGAIAKKHGFELTAPKKETSY